MKVKARTKTELVVETHRILTIKRSRRPRLDWCKDCGRQVQMGTADEAAILAGVSQRAIYQLIESRELHFIETAGRVVFVCLNSLESLF